MEPHRNNRFSSAGEMLEALRLAKASTVVDWQVRKEDQVPGADKGGQGENAWPTTDVPRQETAELAQRMQEGEKKEEERRAKDEAERLRVEQEEAARKEQAEREQQEEEERKAQQQAERLRLEREQRQKEEINRKRQEEQERQRQEEAKRLQLEKERDLKARQEAERKQREDVDRKAKEAKERQHREEEARAAALLAEENQRQLEQHLAREAEERLRLEKERKVREQAEQLKKRAEEERKAREVSDEKEQEEEQRRKTRKEAERLAQQQEETRRQLEREDAERWSNGQREQPMTGETVVKAQTKAVYKIGGVVALLSLIIAVWYGVSASKESVGSKPSSGTEARGAQPPQPRAGVEAKALDPGSFATPNRVVKVALSDDGRVLASAGDENQVRLWLASGAKELVGHTQNATSVAVSHDGQFLASGCKDGTIRLWRVSDGQVIKSWRAHWDNIFSLSFSSDGRTLFSAGWDGNVRLWQLPDGVLNKTVRVPEKDYLIVTINPDSSSLGIYRNDGLKNDGSFRVWSLAEEHLIKALDGWIPSVNCGAFSRDGLLLALGTRAGVEVWSISQGRIIWRDSRVNVSSVAFAAGAQRLAVGFQSGAIKLYTLDGNLIKDVRGHAKSVNGLALSADGHILASGSDDKTVRIWNIGEN